MIGAVVGGGAAYQAGAEAAAVAADGRVKREALENDIFTQMKQSRKRSQLKGHRPGSLDRSCHFEGTHFNTGIL